MKHLIKAVGMGASLMLALLVVGNLLPFAGGYEMGRAFAQPSDPHPLVVPGQSYTFTDERTGKSYTGTLEAVGSRFLAPLGYTPCDAREPVRCLDNSTLPNCTGGGEIALCDNEGNEIEITISTNAAYQHQWKSNHTVIPLTVSPPHKRINEVDGYVKFVVFGSIGGGGYTGAPGPISWQIINVVSLGNGTYLVGYVVTYPDGSVGAEVDEISVPGGILL